MKKSSKPIVKPKELSKQRLLKNELMKLPNNEGRFPNNENDNSIINTKKRTFKKHDRKVEGENLPNPFDLPNYKRIFSKSMGQRKAKPDPFIMTEPHTVCDIDNTFYKVIEGRPLRQQTDIKVYMRNIRDIALNKANAAYLTDQILQFESKHTFELEEHNKTDTLYEKTKGNFVQFAKESYLKAKSIQESAELVALSVTNITDKLESLGFVAVKLRNEISSLVFSFETLAYYGKFLNSVSPNSWRAAFDPDFEEKSIENNKTARRKTGASVEFMDDYKLNIPQFRKPHIYFKTPLELLNIYEVMGNQCLNYMQIDVVTSNIVKTVQKSRNMLKAQVKAETDELEEFIQMYGGIMKYVEQKEIAYKAAFEKLLFSDFQTLYSSTEVTKLHTCVQFVNTVVFDNPEDPKDSVSTLMHRLELEYMQLNSGLDRIDLNIVKKATNQLFAEDIAVMKRAHFAQRTLKECRLLTQALYTSFEPPRPRMMTKDFFKKSVKPEEDKKQENKKL